MVFIIVWKVADKLVRPKNITVGLQSPSLVMNAAFHQSFSLIRTSLYPQSMSNLVKRVHPQSWSISWGLRGSRQQFLIVQAFTSQQSCTGHSLPFFFFIKKKDVAQGLFKGRMVPHAVCSFKNLVSSPCSDCERHMILLMRVGGAPGFRSTVWHDPMVVIGVAFLPFVV